MFEELQLALTDVVTPERLEVFLEAQQLLNQLSFTAADEELQTILGLQDGISDSYLLVSRVEDCLVYAIGEALHQHGIECAADTPLYLMVALLTTVGNIQHYLLPEDLLQMTLQDEDPEVILAGLVPFFTDVDAEQALEVLQNVHPNVIHRITELARERQARDQIEPPRVADHAVRIQKINALRRQQDYPPPQLVVELSRRGVRSGAPLEHLLSQTLDDLEALSLDQIPVEFLALVFFSNTPLDQVLNVTLEHLHDFTDLAPQRSRLEKHTLTLYHSL